MKNRYLTFRQAGDTIIEVMAAITILGLALGAAYGLSNRAFRTAVHSNDRVEALSLAQGQIEFLKNASLKAPNVSGSINNIIATYNNNSPFCFKDSDGSNVPAGPTGDDYCLNYGQGDSSSSTSSIYDISITYCDGSNGCAPTNVFTIQAKWIAGGSGSQNQLTLYYKPQR